MLRKDLADEIRGAGFALRYADGPVVVLRHVDGKRKAMHSARNKIRTTDEDIIRMASTCSHCEAVASEADRELSEQWADCYQSFARLIWPCIDHAPDCPSEPYVTVSGKATRAFAKVKAKFDAERQARKAAAHGKHVGEPAKNQGKERQSTERKNAAREIARLKAELEAARKDLRKQTRKAPKKAAHKRTKPTKKKSPKRKGR